MKTWIVVHVVCVYHKTNNPVKYSILSLFEFRISLKIGIEKLPTVAQWFSEIVPILRGAIEAEVSVLKGSGANDVRDYRWGLAHLMPAPLDQT